MKPEMVSLAFFDAWFKKIRLSKQFLRHKKILEEFLKDYCSGQSGARTLDPRIKSPLLYQLS